MTTLDLGRWCILRMASASTLNVRDALNKAGFDVWTPIERKIGRRPRTRAHYDKRFALMPSYVFADARRIEDLVKLTMSPNPEVRFTIFKHQGGFPLIADAELDALRQIEGRKLGIFERLKAKGKRPPTFAPGTTVQASSGGFEGLAGVVEETRGKFTLVSYAGFHKPIAIASLLLLPEVAMNQLADDATAAQAA